MLLPVPSKHAKILLILWAVIDPHSDVENQDVSGLRAQGAQIWQHCLHKPVAHVAACRHARSGIVIQNDKQHQQHP